MSDTPMVLVYDMPKCGKITLARMVEDTAGCACSSLKGDMKFQSVTVLKRRHL